MQNHLPNGNSRFARDKNQDLLQQEQGNQYELQIAWHRNIIKKFLDAVTVFAETTAGIVTFFPILFRVANELLSFANGSNNLKISNGRSHVLSVVFF
jgi:hypothetical protein